jgi:hypothetical protein
MFAVQLSLHQPKSTAAASSLGSAGFKACIAFELAAGVLWRLYLLPDTANTVAVVQTLKPLNREASIVRS